MGERIVQALKNALTNIGHRVTDHGTVLRMSALMPSDITPTETTALIMRGASSIPVAVTAGIAPDAFVQLGEGESSTIVQVRDVSHGYLNLSKPLSANRPMGERVLVMRADDVLTGILRGNE